MQTPVLQAVGISGVGEDTQRHLTNRYADTAVTCGAPSRPAFLCNGVMIRGTSYKAGRHSWDNSPANHTSGGVSFSYLRKDSKYEKLAYGYSNGYIFLPVYYAGNKITPEILCAFPLDAGTSARANKGCGAYTGIPGSAACQAQGIYTAAAWYNHFRASGSTRAAQCGFDVRDALNDGAATALNRSPPRMNSD
jgi:hypothetical protein